MEDINALRVFFLQIRDLLRDKSDIIIVYLYFYLFTGKPALGAAVNAGGYYG